MLATVIKREIRDLIGSTTFAVTFGVCAALILLSFYVGAMNYRLAVQQHEASQAENVRQMEGLTDWLSVRQHRVFLPPQPLEALVTGISNDIGRTAEIRTRGEIVPEDSRFNEDPIYAAFRFLDLTFVFQIVLSLFAILLGYDAISGEKERGTLRLVFANAIPRATFLMGKLIGAFVALSLSLLVAIGVGGLLLPLLGVHLSGDEWARLGLIILSGMLYFGAFLTLSVFISAVTQKSSSSFVALLVIWIAAVLIVPRASVLLAGRAVTVPSVDEIAAQKATFNRQTWKEFQDDLTGYKPPPMEDPNDFQEAMNKFNQYMDSVTVRREEKTDEFTGRLNESRFNRQKIQERFAFNVARVSPAASLGLAAATLAGTSLSLTNEFRDGANSYRKTFNDFLSEKTGMKVGGRMMLIKIGGEGEEEPEPIDPTEIPGFQFTATTFSRALGAAAVDLGVLAFFNIVFFAGAFVGFMRYDLR